MTNVMDLVPVHDYLIGVFPLCEVEATTFKARVNSNYDVELVFKRNVSMTHPTGQLLYVIGDSVVVSDIKFNFSAVTMMATSGKYLTAKRNAAPGTFNMLFYDELMALFSPSVKGCINNLLVKANKSDHMKVLVGDPLDTPSFFKQNTKPGHVNTLTVFPNLHATLVDKSALMKQGGDAVAKNPWADMLMSVIHKVDNPFTDLLEPDPESGWNKLADMMEKDLQGISKKQQEFLSSATTATTTWNPPSFDDKSIMNLTGTPPAATKPGDVMIASVEHGTEFYAQTQAPTKIAYAPGFGPYFTSNLQAVAMPHKATTDAPTLLKQISDDLLEVSDGFAYPDNTMHYTQGHKILDVLGKWEIKAAISHVLERYIDHFWNSTQRDYEGPSRPFIEVYHKPPGDLLVILSAPIGDVVPLSYRVRVPFKDIKGYDLNTVLLTLCWEAHRFFTEVL